MENALAWDTHLVALGLRQGKYRMVCQGWGASALQLQQMRLKGVLRRTSLGGTYGDEVAILTTEEFAGFVEPESEGQLLRDWLTALPDDASFIVVHHAEWDSGCED